MDVVLDWLPIVAAVFAVPQFLPQLLAVRRTGDVAGVSWSWAALTSVSNGGWIAYFALSRLWTGIVPSISATILAGVLAVLLGRRAEIPRRSAAITAGWAAVLVLAWASAGRTGLGTALVASFVFQVAPSVWTAYRTDRPTGISRGTWLFILVELLSWGGYGLHISDLRLTVLGGTGVAASVLMLARVGRRNPPATVDTASLNTGGPDQDEIDKPAAHAPAPRRGSVPARTEQRARAGQSSGGVIVPPWSR